MRMKISDAYNELMEYSNLPERFRAGSFGLLEEEIETLREFVDSFYEEVEKNRSVDLDDFTEFMGFLFTLWCADSETVMNLLMYAFSRSAMIQNGVR